MVMVWFFTTSVGIASVRALLLLPIQSSLPKLIRFQSGMQQSSSDEPLASRNLCHICVRLSLCHLFIVALTIVILQFQAVLHLITFFCLPDSFFCMKIMSLAILQRTDIFKSHLQRTYIV